MITTPQKFEHIALFYHPVLLCWLRPFEMPSPFTSILNILEELHTEQRFGGPQPSVGSVS